MHSLPLTLLRIHITMHRGKDDALMQVYPPPPARPDVYDLRATDYIGGKCLPFSYGLEFGPDVFVL